MNEQQRRGPGGQPGGDRNSRGPGGNDRGGPGGPRGRGRDDKRGGPGGRFGGREEGSSSGAYRVTSELSTLEKAMSLKDFKKQKSSLEVIAKALRPMKLRSVDALDMGTRGKLITSLLRVVRQTPPPPSEAPAPAEASAPSEPATETPAAEAAPATETAEPAEAAAPAPTESEAGTTEMAVAPTDTTETAEPPKTETAAPAAPAAPVVDENTAAYRDAMYWVGQVWRTMNDERADAAFALSGRTPQDLPEEPVATSAPRIANGSSRGPKKEGARRDSPRRERDASGRPSRDAGRGAAPVFSGTWQEQTAAMEKAGRTRDAARLHERNASFADALRLFEAGGDFKSALRNAASAKDEDAVKRLMEKVPLTEAKQLLEKAGAYEMLMQLYVAAKDYESIAKLYERARQFDQAALAYERAGKFSFARKSYERARDLAGAARTRDLEVKSLEERGDRLGAATVLMAAGMKDRALASLNALPPPKAYRFLQKLKLDEEAKALADKEMAQADAENKPGNKARWFELMGDFSAAGEAWLKADRKDKASMAYEQGGQFARAAELAEGALRYDKAVELFRKAGDEANAQRVAALPPPQNVAPVPESPASETTSATE